MIYVIAYDFGTTGVKTCLFRISKAVELVAMQNVWCTTITFAEGDRSYRAGRKTYKGSGRSIRTLVGQNGRRS